MTTAQNNPGYTHTARSGTNLATFINNQFNGGAVVGAAAPTINGTPIGNVTPSTGSFTYVAESSAVGLTAAGTSSRTGALQLANAINVLGTVASNSGVILPASASVGVGGSVIIFNNGAHLCQVYGSGSDTIDTIAGSTGVPLTNALRCLYTVVSSGAWISAQLGVVSA